MDCSREWSEDDVYLTLATSLTAGMTSDVEGEFNTSDNEPVIRLVGKKMDSDADFNSSDDELLCHYINLEHLEDNDTTDDPTYRPRDEEDFFHSCALLLSHAAADIRNCLCNYLEDNIDSFLDFMVPETEENQRYLQFIENAAIGSCWVDQKNSKALYQQPQPPCFRCSATWCHSERQNTYSSGTVGVPKCSSL